MMIIRQACRNSKLWDLQALRKLTTRLDSVDTRWSVDLLEAQLHMRLVHCENTGIVLDLTSNHKIIFFKPKIRTSMRKAQTWIFSSNTKRSRTKAVIQYILHLTQGVPYSEKLKHFRLKTENNFLDVACMHAAAGFRFQKAINLLHNIHESWVLNIFPARWFLGNCDHILGSEIRDQKQQQQKEEEEEEEEEE